MSPRLPSFGVRCVAAAGIVAAWVAGAAQAAPAPADGKPVPRAVQAPHYGDVLFEFFQDKPFAALGALMSSQHFGRLGTHEDEAELLRGGLLLGYGLHEDAARVFERLAGAGAAPSVRDRAWFFLARLHHQRGEPEAAAQALARVAGPLPGPLEEERLLLAGQVRLALGDTGGAAQALRALLARPPLPLADETVADGVAPQRPNLFLRAGSWLADAFTLRLFLRPPARTSNAAHYARYNLGIALIRGGDVAGGRAALDELGRTDMHDEEGRSLRDQANLALGFAALTAGDAEAAASALERVRLHGRHANKALLGFGWAAAARQQPRQALVPWMELLRRDPADPAVLEARIAVPHALAEAGAPGQALARYQEALAAYDSEDLALQASIAHIRGGEFVRALLQANPPRALGGGPPLARLPETPGLPHRAHLAPVLASHAFQQALRDQRDLVFLTASLADWQDRLSSYRDMLAQRQQAFAQRLPQVRERAAGPAVDALQRQRDALGGQLAAAREAGDGLAFADAAQQDQLARLAQARGLLARQGDALGDAVDVPAVRERLRRLQGALTWQLAQQLPERRWQADKGLQRTDEALAVARQRDAALQAAQREEPARLQAFAGRLDELERRIAALRPRLAALTAAQEQALQAQAVAALQAQRQRLQAYADQARYAVAELYDRATRPATPAPEADRGQP